MNRRIAKAGLEYIEERFKSTPEGEEFILPYIEKHREEIIFGLMHRGEYLIPTPYGNVRVHGTFAGNPVEEEETADPADSSATNTNQKACPAPKNPEIIRFHSLQLNQKV